MESVRLNSINLTLFLLYRYVRYGGKMQELFIFHLICDKPLLYTSTNEKSEIDNCQFHFFR